MSELSLLDRDQPALAPRFDVGGWVLRLSAGVLFLTVGIEKLETESYWVKLFAEIGLGNWFRYLTGALQILGGLLLLVPRTTRAGAFLAGCTMAGAVFVHMFVLDTGIGGALIPAALLVFVGIIALRNPDR
jgi:uncharacterized membrane protein YphA (DoxX/SURF4 family)